jgi:Skp family chaperone for outer membrane proteins
MSVRRFLCVALSSTALLAGVAAYPAFAANTPVQTVPYPGAAAASPSPAPSAAPSSIPSTGSPLPSIVVIDADRVMEQAKAIRSIKSQTDVLQQNFQKELSQKQSELQADQTALQQAQTSLPADQFDAKKRAFEKKLNDVRNDVEAKKASLQRGAAEAMDKVRRALVEVVGGIAQERHATLVLRREMMLYADPSYDATSIALQRLDEKLQSVAVVLPSAPAGTSTVAAAPQKK